MKPRDPEIMTPLAKAYGSLSPCFGGCSSSKKTHVNVLLSKVIASRGGVKREDGS